MARLAWYLERDMGGQYFYWVKGGQPTTDIHQATAFDTFDKAQMAKSVNQLFSYDAREHGFHDSPEIPPVPTFDQELMAMAGDLPLPTEGDIPPTEGNFSGSWEEPEADQDKFSDDDGHDTSNDEF